MNMNTNNVGGRKFSVGGRNQPPKAASDNSSTSSRLNGIILCILKWLTKSSWKWADRSQTLESRALSLLMAFNISKAEAMTWPEMKRFLSNDEGYNFQMCQPITKSIKYILSALDGM